MLLSLLSVFFVAFTDKSGSQPISFAPRAVEQRLQWSIPTDSLDYAVSTEYVDSLRHLGASVYHTSRWMNGATVAMEDSLVPTVEALSFVREVEKTKGEVPGVSTVQRRKMPKKVEMDSVYGYSKLQLDVYNLCPLHAAGYEGQGILMTICDAGFENYDKMSCFDSARYQGMFDFAEDSLGFFASADHGTKCLSTIAAVRNDYRGAATKADYYLMRSEENQTESPKEMDNLIAALEKSDSLGVNIFSVSLGYSRFDDSTMNLTYADMDGVTMRVSRAATIAARKGMLVVAAMGNEGDDEWYYLCAPSDADSILSIGAVGLDSVIAPFSSRGPSADGRVKPEVCAVGFISTIVAPSEKVIMGNGTSFATPLMAGMAACLWSAMPTMPAMEIRDRIIRSAHQYATPDGDYGYGIPNAERAWHNTTSTLDTQSVGSTEVRKFMHEGHLYIQVGSRIYSILGF